MSVSPWWPVLALVAICIMWSKHSENQDLREALQACPAAAAVKS